VVAGGVLRDGECRYRGAVAAANLHRCQAVTLERGAYLLRVQIKPGEEQQPRAPITERGKRRQGKGGMQGSPPR